MKASTMNVGTRAAGALLLMTALLGVAGCPLQTPATAPVGIALSVSSASPLVGQTITLTALVAPGVSVDPSGATWTSSNSSVLPLSSSTGAVIMAVAGQVGTATVTVSAGGLSGSVTITVLAEEAGQVQLDGPTSMNVGDVKSYIATVTDAAGAALNATVTWVASGTVALATTTTNTGPSMNIQAVSVGPGAVTAQAGGRSAQIAVRVTSTNGRLVVTQEDGTAFPTMLAFGQTLTAKASLDSGGGLSDATDAQWTSAGACTLAGSSGATVSIEANSIGSCGVTATVNGMSVTVTFTISNVSTVVISGDLSPIPLGTSRTYTAVAMEGGTAVPGVDIVWSTVGAAVITLTPSGNQVTVSATAVGASMLVATVQGMASKSVTLTVAPATLQLQATSTRLLTGTGTTVTATPLATGGLAGKFASPIGVALVGATGFSMVGPPSLTADGLVTFTLNGATAPSPSVTATFAGVASNALSFTIASVASVVITGPQGPVRVGSTVDLTAVAKDATGMPIGGAVQVLWTDASGVYALPEATNTNMVTASVVKLGTATIVATVMGVASPVFMSPSIPGSIAITAFSPASVAVGGMATATVSILDSNAVAVPGVPLSQVSMMSADGTKVSVDAGVLVSGGFLFTATGLAAAAAPGIGLTATWSDGAATDDIMSATVFLIVTGP